MKISTQYSVAKRHDVEMVRIVAHALFLQHAAGNMSSRTSRKRLLNVCLPEPRPKSFTMILVEHWSGRQDYVSQNSRGGLWGNIIKCILTYIGYKRKSRAITLSSNSVEPWSDR